MSVRVENALPCFCAGVELETERTFGKVSGYLSTKAHDVQKRFLVASYQVSDIRKVLFWNNQNVDWLRWVDVIERYGMLRLGHQRSGDLTCNNLAENTFSHRS
jgi:hypothetical protein